MKWEKRHKREVSSCTTHRRRSPEWDIKFLLFGSRWNCVEEFGIHSNWKKIFLFLEYEQFFWIWCGDLCKVYLAVIIITLSWTFTEYYVPSKIEKGSGQIKTCSYYDYPDPKFNEVCEVDVRDWGDCNKDQFFNYHKNSPCIFLKLNKIYGWVPEYYDDPNNLPKEMPKQLSNHIKSINNTREVRNVVFLQDKWPLIKNHNNSL